MSESLVLTPATRALVVAMRLWHFDRENWWTKMQPLGARLERRAGMELLMALDGLMTVLAAQSGESEQAVRSKLNSAYG